MEIDEYTTDVDMGESDNENDDTVSDSDDESDIEYKLQHLKEYDNLKQLKLLNKEIAHILAHGIVPPDDWYTDRFMMIYTYSTLGWENLARRFENRDEYIYNSASFIVRLLHGLLEERSVRATFNLENYSYLLYNIRTIWDYYNRVYMAGETDIDVLDLIEGIQFL